MTQQVPLLFRLAAEADIAVLVDLVESAYRGDASRVGWTTEADLLDGQRTDPLSLGEIIGRPGSVIVLAEREGELLACANLEQLDKAAYFGMFAVRPGLQGGGIGNAVIVECERIARDEWGSLSVRMTVIWSRVELIAWYERRGYRPTGERKAFPYGDKRFGLPKRDDLYFEVYQKNLA